MYLCKKLVGNYKKKFLAAGHETPHRDLMAHYTIVAALVSVENGLVDKAFTSYAVGAYM